MVHVLHYLYCHVIEFVCCVSQGKKHQENVRQYFMELYLLPMQQQMPFRTSLSPYFSVNLHSFWSL
jgi:hypothetical protein